MGILTWIAKRKEYNAQKKMIEVIEEVSEDDITLLIEVKGIGKATVEKLKEMEIYTIQEILDFDWKAHMSGYDHTIITEAQFNKFQALARAH